MPGRLAGLQRPDWMPGMDLNVQMFDQMLPDRQLEQDGRSMPPNKYGVADPDAIAAALWGGYFRGQLGWAIAAELDSCPPLPWPE